MVKENTIVEKYKIESLIGKGTFGNVFKVYDIMDKTQIALKMVNFKNGTNSDTNEHKLLQMIGHIDPENNHVIKLYEHFMWRGHLCMALEIVRYDLKRYIEITGGTGLTISLIQKYSYQLCAALEFLNKPELKIVHADIKPDNIMLCAPYNFRIKLADLSISFQEHKCQYFVVQTVPYRALEVILRNYPYKTEIDMWSLGCTLVEMYTGSLLFMSKDEDALIYKIIQLLGIPSTKILDKGQNTSKYFRKFGVDSYTTKRLPGKVFNEPSQLTLTDIFEKHDKDSPKHNDFIDLILKMLEFDPTKRITPGLALQHAFHKDIRALKSVNDSDDEIIVD